MLAAGFDDFAGKALSDFDGLGKAATLGHQSGNIRAGPQVTSTGQRFNTDADGHFFHIRDMNFSFHEGLRYGPNYIRHGLAVSPMASITIFCDIRHNFCCITVGSNSVSGT